MLILHCRMDRNAVWTGLPYGPDCRTDRIAVRTGRPRWLSDRCGASDMRFASREKAVLSQWGVAVMPSDRRRAPIPRRPPAPSGCWCRKNTPANTGIEVLGRVDFGDRNHDDRVAVIAPWNTLVEHARELVWSRCRGHLV